MNEDRRKSRQIKAVMAGMKIAERLGKGTPSERVEEIRIVCLSALAECRATRFLLERKGLTTSAESEDALDAAFDDLLAQIDGKAAEVIVHGSLSGH